MPSFKLISDFSPRGDQPKAIEQLVLGLTKKNKFQTLLGVTGSGKTYTMANVIAQVQKPTLVISPNKTLAAQLCQEFRTFFPENAVEYFVSYYDYYQPEAYVPQTDTYIAKDASINDEIDRLRHSTTRSLFQRDDAIVVASVSCIYGLGTPEDYQEGAVVLGEVDEKRFAVKGQMKISRDELIKQLVSIKYERNDVDFSRGKFRVRGDVVEVFPAYEQNALRVEFFGDEIERMLEINPLTGEIIRTVNNILIFPATHYVTFRPRLERAIQAIETELKERLAWFKKHNKLLEAQRLERQTRFDLELLREMGYCSGIENYSRYLAGRKAGDPPATLLDYFPEDFLLIVDESHVTIPQIGGMYAGDASRKKVLIEHGFRLPSARDNRPLNFKEFEKHINQVIFVSATPGPYERKYSQQIVEQIIRPTGLIDPEVIVRPVKGQIDDLIIKIKGRVEKGERTLVTTLTKRMAEDLSEYLHEEGIKVRYLHSDIATLDRIDILRGLRLGEFDVLVGINLLREGLDLPEVSLVAILDADKEGFLRSGTSLIQTIGRTARNVNGQVILYAEQMTGSMRHALSETNRRRRLQLEHNKKHGITPQTIVKAIQDIRDNIRVAKEIDPRKLKQMVPPEEVPHLIKSLEEDMRVAATELEFEKAAILRDRVKELKKAFRLGT